MLSNVIVLTFRLTNSNERKPDDAQTKISRNGAEPNRMSGARSLDAELAMSIALLWLLSSLLFASNITPLDPRNESLLSISQCSAINMILM